jgi:hypothetical protein
VAPTWGRHEILASQAVPHPDGSLPDAPRFEAGPLNLFVVVETGDGEKLLLSLWEEDGAVIVYDAVTLEEEQRIPMSRPSGKYNVWNKTR